MSLSTPRRRVVPTFLPPLSLGLSWPSSPLRAQSARRPPLLCCASAAKSGDSASSASKPDGSASSKPGGSASSKPGGNGPLSPAAATPGEDVGRVSSLGAGDDSWRIYEQEGNPCVICLGTGKCKCLHCFGDGVVYIGPNRERDEVTCPQCDGRQADICPRCRGTGVRPSTRLDFDTLTMVPNCTNEDISLGRNVETHETHVAEETVEDVENRVAETVDTEASGSKR